MRIRAILLLFSVLFSFSVLAESNQFGKLFLVDQYRVKTSMAWLSHAISSPRESPLGVILWNFDKADKGELSHFSLALQKRACEAGKAKLWITTDFEGGADRLLLSGAKPPPIQHFIKDLTKFPHPRLLGEAWDKRESLSLDVLELANLFGFRLGRELYEAGISSPLSVAADLATNQMWYRGLHKEPKVSAALLKEIYNGFLRSSDGIFFTKHFPGLGAVASNTHGALAKARYAPGADLQDHLLPFKELIDLDKSQNKDSSRLGIMVGHALYPEDPVNVASRSPYFLQDVLRKKLGFTGLVVSDAMWMGIYKKMHNASEPQSEHPLQVYLQSFLAGVDVLMIKAGKQGSYFKAAVKYFSNVWHGRLSAKSWQSLEAKLGIQKKEIRQRFAQRFRQTSARLESAGFASPLSKIHVKCGMMQKRYLGSRLPIYRGNLDKEASLEKQVSRLREQVSKVGRFAGKKQTPPQKNQL